MQQEGFIAVSPYGENQSYDPFMAELKGMGVEVVWVLLDNDETGHRGAVKAHEAAVAWDWLAMF
jgi:hypothetical protein